MKYFSCGVGMSIMTSTFILLSGCTSYPRLSGDTPLKAEALKTYFGHSDAFKVISSEEIRGSTLTSSIKVFVTDKTSEKRYFGTKGNVFVQNEGFTAWGILTFDVDNESSGNVGKYFFKDGLVVTDFCQKESEEQILLLKGPDNRVVCYITGCNSALPNGWAKYDCTLTPGNTLRTRK